jgi:hypothetical protein
VSDGKEVARKARNTPEVERSLRQFLNHDGPKGNNKNYDRRYDFMFVLTPDQRAEVNLRIDAGMSFDEAFDEVKAIVAELEGQ